MRGLHHLAIQVRDLVAMERFYREVLGLAELRRWPDASGKSERSVWLDAGDGAFIALELVAGGATAAEDEARGTQPGLHLVALGIERASRADWERRLAEASIAIERRTAFTLYVRDPEGNRVGLSHWPEEAAS